MDVERLLLTARTVRHLRPEQVAHRVRLQAQRKLVQAAPRAVEAGLRREPPTNPGWPDGFVPLDGRLPTGCELDDLDTGRFTLLGQSRTVEDWRSKAPPQLWRYHLHYWDWAWALAQDSDRLRARSLFRRLFRQWQRQTRFGRWDEWSPYVVALRAWSWCGQYDALVRGTDLDDEFVALLGVHAGYLRTHLELDVSGNHLIKDLKGLVGLAVFLRDQRLLVQALRRLRREVGRQILDDGGHVERAPAYHCQVLGDLVDVDGLLGHSAPAWLGAAIARMRRWLGLVLLPDGTVPLLNDGFPVRSELVAALEPGPPAPEGLTMLADTGLAILRRGQGHVLADIGLPCPDDLPAHAHADTLGFLLHVGTTRVVSEVGTSTYAAGAVRDFERSTAAHSTVQVDGADSTEVWGAFRAARRARPTVLRADDDGTAVVLSASHDGYRRLPGRPVHRRTWELAQDRLRVMDQVAGEGEHELTVRLHGTPSDLVVAAGDWKQEEVLVARGWEDRVPAPVLVHRERARLPWRFEAELSTKGCS